MVPQTKTKKATGLDFARENRCSCHRHCIHHQVCLQMHSQYAARSKSPTTTAADSITDTHLQASYHTIPIHRCSSVIYYVTSAKMCESCHRHPHTHCLYVSIPLLERKGVNSDWNSHNAHQKCQSVSLFALLTTEVCRHVHIQESVVQHRDQSEEETVSVVIAVIYTKTVVWSLTIHMLAFGLGPPSIFFLHWCLNIQTWPTKNVFHAPVCLFLINEFPISAVAQCR